VRFCFMGELHPLLLFLVVMIHVQKVARQK
jgi:hypothetical protein